MNQRKPNPGPALGRELPERARALRLSRAPAQGRLPPLPRPHEPGQGLPPRDRRSRRRPSIPLMIAGKMPRPRGEGVLRGARAAATSAGGIEYLGEVDHAREGGPAPERPGNALPDRVGRAVRPRHDRVDGVRDARDRDALGRRPRGDRRRAHGRDRRRLPGHARRARAGRRARPDGLPPLRRGALLLRPDGPRLRSGLREGARRAPPRRPS